MKKSIYNSGHQKAKLKTWQSFKHLLLLKTAVSKKVIFFFFLQVEPPDK